MLQKPAKNLDVNSEMSLNLVTKRRKSTVCGTFKQGLIGPTRCGNIYKSDGSWQFIKLIYRLCDHHENECK